MATIAIDILVATMLTDSRQRRLVLDTNIVLDCLVFRDPATRDLAMALEERAVQALVHQYAVDEFKRVLTYPQCRLTSLEQRDMLDRYLASTTLTPMPDGFSTATPLLPPGFPRCRDQDDEPFLALAYHGHADGLITKDKALLKLRRKAARFSVTILAPEQLHALEALKW
jgi:putative PIN family toxin of toxin-antitoxin system